MKKQMIGLLSIFAALFIFVGCSNSNDGSVQSNNGNEGNDSQKETVTLTFNTNPGYAPFEYLDKGEIVGFEIDLLNAMAEAGGFNVNIKDMGWEAQFIELDNQSVDGVMSSVTITPKREESYTFSKPYFENYVVILVPKDSTITSATDLTADMNIGVLSGSTSQFAAEAIFGENAKNIKRYEDNPLAILGLKNNEVDVVICDELVASYHIKNNPNDNLKVVEDRTNFEAEYYGVCLQKNSPHQEMINNALKTIVDNGKYAEIYQAWVGEEPNLDYMNE